MLGCSSQQQNNYFRFLSHKNCFSWGSANLMHFRTDRMFTKLAVNTTLLFATCVQYARMLRVIYYSAFIKTMALWLCLKEPVTDWRPQVNCTESYGWVVCHGHTTSSHLVIIQCQHRYQKILELAPTVQGCKSFLSGRILAADAPRFFR